MLYMCAIIIVPLPPVVAFSRKHSIEYLREIAHLRPRRAKCRRRLRSSLGVAPVKLEGP